MIRPLISNLGWRLLSLAIAVLLWITFVGSPDVTMALFAPIEYRNIPSDLEMVSEVPERVFVEVKGASARLRSIDVGHTAVTLEVGRVPGPGEHTFTIDEHNVELPPGVHLVRTVPSQIRLAFEHRIRRDVPVRARFAADPPDGYSVASAAVNPPRVRISGPDSRVKAVAYAETDPIDLSKVVGSAEFRVQAFVPDQHVRLVSSPAVTVTVTLHKR